MRTHTAAHVLVLHHVSTLRPEPGGGPSRGTRLASATRALCSVRASMARMRLNQKTLRMHRAVYTATPLQAHACTPGHVSYAV